MKLAHTLRGTGFVFLSLVICLVQACSYAQGTDIQRQRELQSRFEQHIAPVLREFCFDCHSGAAPESGVRVDRFDGSLAEENLDLWKGIAKQIEALKMPPEDEAQPSERQNAAIIDWIRDGLAYAQTRPQEKNGSVRRLTVSQYKNSLQALLGIGDDLTDRLPPDAKSKDGFLNNRDAMVMSPILINAYFEIAQSMLDRCIVDAETTPSIQCFRVDLGTAINPQPCPDRLILGANSHLLSNEDFRVVELKPKKGFAYQPATMRTKYRFNEGYQGNSTVRGWRDYDSIYHAVFACMRGNRGYPKGNAYETIPNGLLLRPAIPSAELFQVESTYGPRANFKISLRELPDLGKFRVTVRAARYNDGLLLDSQIPSSSQETPQLEVRDVSNARTIEIPTDGIYRVDVHLDQSSRQRRELDRSRLAEGLVGTWDLDGDATSANQPGLDGSVHGGATFEESPFGQALSLDGNDDFVSVPRHDAMNVADGDFTVAAWIRPTELRQGGIVCLGKYSWVHGWYFDMPNPQGVLRIETVNPANMPNGTVASRPGVIRKDQWQHVAAVVRRGSKQTRLYVNGYQVAQGTVAGTNLDNPNVNLHIGRIQDSRLFKGQIDQVRLYRRALDLDEIHALLESGRQFVQPPPAEKPQNLKLLLGQRSFSGILRQPQFVVARLKAGPLSVQTQYAGSSNPDRVAFTRLEESDEAFKQFQSFEKRTPSLGVHLGLRRDCGSTFALVGEPQQVQSHALKDYVFEGAIANFPNPDVQADNDNYLAGIREIGVRSEYTDGRDMPRLLIHSVQFEGPYIESWPPASHQKLFIDSNLRSDENRYAEAIISSFATRAYRRAPDQSEIGKLVSVYQDARADGRSFQESVSDAMQVTLTSPQFLFQIESSQSPRAEPLDPYELASKLSYFLWDGPPDQQLLSLCASGKLFADIDHEIDRMVADPRMLRFCEQFTSQWLDLDKLDVVETDRRRYPKLTRDTKSHLRQEPIQFVRHLIQENLPASNLVQSEFVVANEVVASYYGIDYSGNSGLRFQPFRHQMSDQLGGLLSQAGILTGLSNGRDSNPIKRGAWLARKIVAEPPDDPPPNVPALSEDDASKLTLRQQLEKHRDAKGCANCHAGIDPWGIPLEQYDAGGRLKQGRAFTAESSKLPDGTVVTGVSELKAYLAGPKVDQVAFSFAKHLATYAIGRTLTYTENEQLKQDCRRLADGNYRALDILKLVIHSAMFMEK